MSTTLVWFTEDLRLGDNPLLRFATPPESLLCVYLLCPEQLAPLNEHHGWSRMGAARRRFLWQSLIALRGELLKRGSDLLVRVAEPVAALTELVATHGVSEVRVRRPASQERGDQLERLAAALPEGVRLWPGESGTLLDEAALPFALEALPGSFSAFRRRVEAECHIPLPRPAPFTLPPWPREASRGLPPLVEVCGRAHQWRPDPRGGFLFRGGEAAGHERLEGFCRAGGPIGRYKQTRNGLLGSDFSTRLSPWLALGCLSARQVHRAVRDWETAEGANESSYWVIFELWWRDYFHWAARQEGRALFGSRRLSPPSPAFDAWRQGETGLPFVDAAMRELATTGWLSNRARQNVASFLVKDLGVDWRLGAAWFEHALVDYEVASNWGNWRYVAGVGRDPRGDRYFNLLRQARHYDPRGDYVAHWLPALAALPAGLARHQPWRAAPGEFAPPRVIPGAWQDELLPLASPASRGEERGAPG
ncbi:DASH family cryptochrome [Halomonas salifodinae]|uniref:DASH family cryptochrome n=1 Tax=Halomonas salifodinae TaxID=438745 RepID=UPI0033BBD388